MLSKFVISLFAIITSYFPTWIFNQHDKITNTAHPSNESMKHLPLSQGCQIRHPTQSITNVLFRLKMISTTAKFTDMMHNSCHLKYCHRNLMNLSNSILKPFQSTVFSSEVIFFFNDAPIFVIGKNCAMQLLLLSFVKLQVELCYTTFTHL